MNKIKNIGYVVAFLGMGVFMFSLLKDSALWVETIRNGGVVLFAIGMAVLLSALSFTLGMEKEKEKLRKTRFLNATKKVPVSSGILAYSPDDDGPK